MKLPKFYLTIFHWTKNAYLLRLPIDYILKDGSNSDKILIHMNPVFHCIWDTNPDIFMFFRFYIYYSIPLFLSLSIHFSSTAFFRLRFVGPVFLYQKPEGTVPYVFM
jgi:hypothetical protein